MHIKQIEVSLSKEERRIVDEYGNTASTWARIGITADLVKGDVVADCIVILRDEIQPQVDDWLLRQGQSYTPPTIEEIEESLAEITAEAAGAEGDDEIPL